VRGINRRLVALLISWVFGRPCFPLGLCRQRNSLIHGLVASQRCHSFMVRHWCSARATHEKLASAFDAIDAGRTTPLARRTTIRRQSSEVRGTAVCASTERRREGATGSHSLLAGLMRHSDCELRHSQLAPSVRYRLVHGMCRVRCVHPPTPPSSNRTRVVPCGLCDARLLDGESPCRRCRRVSIRFRRSDHTLNGR
jgi:hypothetical protein